MGNVAIRVSDLGKKYQIGRTQKAHDRLSEQLVHFLGTPLRRASRLLRGEASGAAELDETMWALRHVTLEIRHGETLGIIGPNGAGKSTMLKIFSRITEPSQGRVELYGRIGSLLEVGTGFHPELTGRENVYLNGAILGMRRHEIGRKFDEIVSFAEIEKFLDTPVKHYSSGMYVRLAFSVAAHLEPEILVVDEVLAVGDLAFQRKCLGKMGEVANEGRTVLFVSHNLGLVESLCRRAVLLQQGRLAADGETAQTVDSYLSTLEGTRDRSLIERTDRRGVGRARVTEIEIERERGQPATVLRTGQPARFVFTVDRRLHGLSLSFGIFDNLGQPLVRFSTRERGPQDKKEASMPPRFACELERLQLLPGRYRIDVWVAGDGRMQDSIQSAAAFDVAEGLLDGRPAQSQTKFKMSHPHRWILPGEDD